MARDPFTIIYFNSSKLFGGPSAGGEVYYGTPAQVQRVSGFDVPLASLQTAQACSHCNLTLPFPQDCQATPQGFEPGAVCLLGRRADRCAMT